MYITVHNRPAAPTVVRAGRGRVARTVVMLGLVSLLTDISTEMVTAALPLFVTVGLGLSPLAFGVADSIYQAGTATARIAGGYVADRLDRPKGVAVAGYGLGAVAKLLLLPVAGLTALSVALGVDRVGKGLRTGPRDAVIVAASAPAMLGRAFGVHRALDTTGALLGPVVAFGLLWLVPFGFDVLFVVAACLAGLGVLLLITQVPADRDPARTSDKATGRTLRLSDAAGLLRQSAFRRLLVAAGLLSMCLVSDAFIYLSMLERGLVSGVWFPLLFLGTSVVYLALAVPVGRLADRWSRIGVFVAGHGCVLAVYLLVAVTSSTAAAVAAVAALGGYYAATDGVLPAAAAPLAPAKLRATAISTVQTVVALGRAAAALTFGAVWVLVGPAAALLVFALTAGCALAAAVPLLRSTVETDNVEEIR